MSDESDDIERSTQPVDDSDTATGSTAPATASGAPAPRKVKKQRTSPRQFLKEVRSELRKVAWPSRKELFSYSLVVLVSVTIITLYITALDQVFGTLIVRIFGS